MEMKVVAAMSGGVDSAVAAYLLKEQGYDVIGVTLRLSPDSDDKVARTGRCCSIEDMTDARQACDRIGIPFYAVDARAQFKKHVFDPFVNSYLKGITPIPCLECNHTVKFGDLFHTADRLKAQLATGHYARIVSYKGHQSIARPVDEARDQTYYLYGCDPDKISRLHFPLGDVKKDRVREIARNIGLTIHNKKDSHEICFVPDGDHARVVEKASGIASSGDVVDENGKTIGQHQGVHHFTVGQRRGLKVSAGHRVYVADIDADSQRVVLAEKNSLMCTRIAFCDLRLMVPIECWPENVSIKIRARSQAQSARVEQYDRGSDEITAVFDKEVYSVALGQAAVVYDKDVVLGGGIISGRLDGAFPRTNKLSRPFIVEESG
jgi:tRNA-specific 2-thiouridylase